MKKKISVFLCLLLMLMLFAGCNNKEQWYKKTDVSMGTVIDQSIYGDKSSTEEYFEEIQVLLKTLEDNELSFKKETSEIYKINENAADKKGYAISDALAEEIEKCKEVSVASGGKFDISIGRLIRLWDIDNKSSGAVANPTVPDTPQIKEAISHRESEKSDFIDESISISEGKIYLARGVEINLGAVGKGIALDRVLQYFEGLQEKPKAALFSAGGSVLTYGKKPDDSLFRVGIVDPFDTDSLIGYLQLEGQWCISTSGDYERFFEVDGIRYHHILDPDTGYPAESDVKSVTIVTKEGWLSDALSTACFILGKEEGMKLVQSFGAEALFVDWNQEVFMTDGMNHIFVAVEKGKN